MRCPQCARTVEEGAPFCTCGYPVFWDERAEPSHVADHPADGREDLSRIPDEQTVPPPPRRAVRPTDPAPPTEQLVPLLTCPDCEAPNPMARTLCQRCGALLQPAESHAPPGRPQRRRAMLPTGILLVAVALVLAAAAAWTLGLGRDGRAGGEPADAATPASTIGTATENATATTSPTPTAAAAVTHLVEPGETLTTIAQRYGTTVAALVRANGIADPDVITLGQQLVIPAPGSTPGPQ